jgi:serine/threonine protein kinase
MGVVFLAEDTRCRREVALKALKPNLPNILKARQRFLREGKATAGLHHENVITIYDVGESDEVPYLAMEYLQGETLDARLRREGRLSLPEVLRIGRETAEGLAAAHDHGLIHRDVKPTNLWLEATSHRVKILDFGLARHAAGDQTNLTQAGCVVGTPGYMSPEQAKGERIDARADLFSLGCVLYRTATGEVPFKGKDTVSTLMALIMDAPAPPVEHRPDLPPELNHLILCLLAKQREQRPPSGVMVGQAIRIIEQRLAPAPAPIAPTGELGVSVASASAGEQPRGQGMLTALVVAGAALVALALMLFLAAL